MENKWYFTGQRVAEITLCEGNNYWHKVIGEPGYPMIDSWFEKSRIFKTEVECLDYALNFIKEKMETYADIYRKLDLQYKTLGFPEY